MWLPTGQLLSPHVSTSSTIGISLRGTANRTLEVYPEERGIGKVKQVGDLLDTVGVAAQQDFGPEDDEVLYPLGCPTSADSANHVGKIFLCDAQFVGIKGDIAMFLVIG